jgi:hypothetical protein
MQTDSTFRWAVSDIHRALREQEGGDMGNIETTPEERARAKFLGYAKRKMKQDKKSGQKRRSVKTISGGLSSLGKRR